MSNLLSCVPWHKIMHFLLQHLYYWYILYCLCCLDISTLSGLSNKTDNLCVGSPETGQKETCLMAYSDHVFWVWHYYFCSPLHCRHAQSIWDRSPVLPSSRQERGEMTRRGVEEVECWNISIYFLWKRHRRRKGMWSISKTRKMKRWWCYHLSL